MHPWIKTSVAAFVADIGMTAFCELGVHPDPMGAAFLRIGLLSALAIQVIALVAAWLTYRLFTRDERTFRVPSLFGAIVAAVAFVLGALAIVGNQSGDMMAFIYWLPAFSCGVPLMYLAILRNPRFAQASEDRRTVALS